MVMGIKRTKLSDLLVFILSILTIFFLWSNYAHLALFRCSNLTEAAKTGCWQGVLAKEVQRRGVNSSFEVLARLYETEADFAESCHDFAHVIGEAAYAKYTNFGTIDFSEKAGYCGFGFYHGYIISMTASTQKLSEVKEFCSLANKTLSNSSGGVLLDCYHGIGHGVADYSLGDVSKATAKVLIDNSLAFCEEISENDNQLSRCSDGVYHALTEVGVEAVASHIKDDPTTFCLSQDINYQEACFSSLGFLLMQLNGDNFGMAAGFSKEVGRFGAGFVRQLAGYQGYRTVDAIDHGYEIEVCRSLGGNLSKACMMGLIEGMTDFGEPQEEHLSTIDFCHESAFAEEEKDFCLNHAVGYFETYFGKERKKDACRILQNSYNYQCT